MTDKLQNFGLLNTGNTSGESLPGNERIEENLQKIFSDRAKELGSQISNGLHQQGLAQNWHQGNCPRCGYCPHCGRGGHQHPFYPQSPYQPWYSGTQTTC